MSNFEIILFSRVVVLLVGTALAWLGGIVGMRFYNRIPNSQIKRFTGILSISVILLGGVMLFIALGNLLVYFLKEDWTYIVLVTAGLVGIASVAVFIYGFREIYNYVVMK